MSDDAQLPELPSGPDSLLEELQVRSRDDVRWAGLWKVVHLPDWKNRIHVQGLRSLQSCIPTGIVLTNVHLPQGVAVTLNSVGQVKEFGSKEWYFVYLCECDTASTVPPTTGAETTSPKAPSTGAATEMLTTCALTTTGEPGTTAEPTTVTPCVNLCNDCEPPLECEYLITLEDLGGAFGPFNGSWCVPYTGRVGDNCAYILPFDIEDYPNANLWMTWDYVAPLCWGVIAALEGGCGKTWKRQIVPAAFCQPLGVYSEAWCVSDNCIWGDPDPCPPSAGATCVVSDC